MYRLLAHRLQGPFYQRLRVELQLGYAVFSALRQVQGHTGLLLGVQSPKADPAQILEHMRCVVAGFTHDLTDDAEARQALAAQFHEPDMGNADVAEWAWQARLAGSDTPAWTRCDSSCWRSPHSSSNTPPGTCSTTPCTWPAPHRVDCYRQRNSLSRRFNQTVH